MTVHIPNSWVILKSPKKHPQAPFYKVFGEWRGGYLDGDSWRLNSGIKSVDLEGNPGHWVWMLNGYSGSSYWCEPAGEGIKGVYCTGVLNQLIEKGFELISLTDFLEEFKENET